MTKNYTHFHDGKPWIYENTCHHPECVDAQERQAIPATQRVEVVKIDAPGHSPVAVQNQDQEDESWMLEGEDH